MLDNDGILCILSEGGTDMWHSLLFTVIVAMVLASQGRAQEKKLTEVVKLGDCRDLLVLEDAEWEFSDATGLSVILKLQVQVDEIDTGHLSYKGGFFDDKGEVHLASELHFKAEFPLSKGDRVT